MEKYSDKKSVNSLTKKILLAGGLLVILIFCSLFMLLFMMTTMPGSSIQGPVAEATPAQSELAVKLRNHVNILANTVGPRHEEEPVALNRAADYILTQFRRFGYNPEESLFGEERFRNINVTLPGTEIPGEILVLGAHYDTARTGTPGADDNASGVAVLLEIASALTNQDLKRSVRFVSFANEELPYFNTDLMGSRVTARLSAESDENIIGMFSLEMLGYYTDEPGSQHYPPIIRDLYPHRGNFIAFVSDMSSRPLLHQAIGAFREQSVFPAEGMAAPQFLVPDIRRSDNASYWDYGFPAVMVTDTSNFRTPYYHTIEDTVDSLDYDSMARVVEGLTGMVITLANTVE